MASPEPTLTPSDPGFTAPESDAEFDDLLRGIARVSMPPCSAARPLPPGATLLGGRFSVIRRLGEGGMGVVYEVWDAERGGRVALKTLSRVDAVGVYRLKREFRALADVRHPHLVRLHELFADGDSWFFTMDVVPGKPFEQWAREGGRLVRDEHQLSMAVRQLVSAILAIHDAGKLHRDLKPSNVLVTSDGHVTVLDFGLVASSGPRADALPPAPTRLVGTPAYMAPEQAAGCPATEASDAYALGVTLFEALTGKLPFEGAVDQILHDKQERDAPRASAHAVVPPELDAWCAALLQRQPSLRPDRCALRRWAGLPTPLPSAAPRAISEVGALRDREAELSVLREAHGVATAGVRAVVRVSGETGVGKTALVDAFLSDVAARDPKSLVIAGRCHEREYVPYRGLDALIDDLCRQLRATTDPQALLPDDIASLSVLFPVLGQFLAPDGPPTRDGVDPDEIQRRAFAAFDALLWKLRREHPVILFIDDFQWVDQDALRLFRALWSQPEAAPVLWIVAHTDSDPAARRRLESLFSVAKDNRHVLVRAVAVRPLAATTLRSLVRDVLGPAADHDARLPARVATEAAGNPAWVLELARHLSGSRTREVSISLDDMLRTRVDGLVSPARALLTVVAVAEQPLPLRVAVAAARVEQEHLLVELLAGERLMRRTRSDGAYWVDCYDGRVRTFVRGLLTDSELGACYRDLVRALSAVVMPEPGLSIRCLEHLGEHEQAAQLAASGADQAASMLAFDRAAELYQKALSLGRFTVSREHALWLGLADCLARAGHGFTAADAYLSARSTAPAGDVARLTRMAGEQCVLGGHVRRGRALLAEGMAPLGESLAESTAAALVSAMASRARFVLTSRRFTPRAEHSRTTLERLEALRSAAIALSRTDPIRSADLNARWTLAAQRAGHAAEYASALGWQIGLSGLLRQPWNDVQPLDDAAWRASTGVEGRPARVWLHYGRGAYHLMRGQPWSGDYEQALTEFDSAIALMREYPHAGASYDVRWLHYQRANALTMLGRFDEADRIAQLHMEAAWAVRDMAILPAWAMTASYVRCAVGNIDQAARELQRAQQAWQPDELTYQDMMLLAAVMVQAAYRGDTRAAWDTCQVILDRIQSRWAGRLLFGKVTAPLRAIWAAAAAIDTPPGSTRRRLLREVEVSCRKAQGWEPTLATNARAALACVVGDRDRAVRELRTLLNTPSLTPTWGFSARRRLGVLLGGDEGAALITDADGFFHRGGVVDPERLTAAVLPGLEIR